MIFRQATRRNITGGNTAKKPLGRSGAFAALSLCASCACLLWGHPKAQSDMRASGGGSANAIVRRMVAMYQGAQTLQEKAEATLQELGGRGEYIQTTQLKYSRANGSNYLYIRSTDPKDGTYEAYVNGKSITVYRGAQNAYTKRATTGALRQNVELLSKAAESFTETMNNQGEATKQLLNPISFLGAKGMPDECKNFQMVRQDTVEGRRAFVVRGEADPDWLYSLVRTKAARYDSKSVTLWIDAENSTLLKAQCDLRFHVDLPRKTNQPATTVQYGLTLSEVHRDIVVNAPINDQEFNFDLNRHKGAVEKYQEHK